MCIRDRRDAKHLNRLKELVVRDEGFLTYGGMSTKAVSYTHLDVYKRQQQMGPAFRKKASPR